MDSEIDKLRRDLKRYRFLLSGNTDQQADRVIREQSPTPRQAFAPSKPPPGERRSHRYRRELLERVLALDVKSG
jgi:hypothetical protein